MSNPATASPVTDPPVAARETRRARARARRAARRQRLYSALVLACSLLLLAGGGVAYHDHAQRQPLELPLVADTSPSASPTSQ